MQRGKDGISLSASKPLEPSEMPEPPKPPRPNWFKRTFSFLSKGWQKEIQDYNDKLAMRAADMQAT